ncbi:MAG: autotransporter assembly complex protein TamA [Burkholderiales bacterium]
MNRRMKGLRSLTALAAVLALTACSHLPFGKQDAARSTPAETPTAVMYELVLDAPGPLRSLLFRHLDLARFQRLPASDAISPGELSRLMAAAPAQAKALLETEGYFNATVSAQREGSSPDAVGTVPRVLLRIDPGPRTQVSSLALDVQGPLREALQKADPAAISTWVALHRDWLLRPDAQFRGPQWTAAKAALLDRLRADGYPQASWVSTEARIDAVENSAALDVTAESGPLFRLRSLRIEGLKRHGEASVRNAVNFQPGTPYSERLLLDWAERLRKLDLFESTVVELDPEATDPSSATAIVRVRELPQQQATVGVGFSDNTGPRATLEYTHRRIFGLPWIAKNKVEWGGTRQLLDVALVSHPLNKGYRGLLAVNVLREDAAGTVVESSRFRAGGSLDTERLDRLVFAENLAAREGTDRSMGPTKRAVSGNVHWIRRDLDSVLLPTEGDAWNLQGALGQAWLDASDRKPFGRLYVRYSGYRPLGKTWYGSARLEAAQVFVNDANRVPDPLLFRAGGDESVRGYGYRSLGPVKNGSTTSGRVLLTGSMEVARPIFPNQPALWWAAFVDAGHAADRWGDLHPVFGYGIGLRWRSPVGPLRVDLAYGDALQKLRLHLSVGIAF